MSNLNDRILTITDRNGLRSPTIGPYSTSPEIVSFMNFIWATADPFTYRDWHNPRRVMRLIGGRKTYTNKEKSGIWQGWLLPSGSRIKILIDGSAISEPFNPTIHHNHRRAP